MPVAAVDLDFEQQTVTVRSGKGGKDRVTLFPASIHARMRVHLDSVRPLYLEDRRLDRPGVPLPNALERKYPAAATDWLWYWIFPARKLSADPRTGTQGRYHVYPTSASGTSAA